MPSKNRFPWKTEVRRAIRHFWRARTAQADQQGGGLESSRDRGERSAVTGGRHLDGFLVLVRKLLHDCGLPEETVFCRQRTRLPGWYRAEKDWDLIVVHQSRLIAVLEFKSQVGPSFGNNFNNRTEEALGNATDFWAAFREGAFQPALKPWLGYLMLLEDSPKSNAPVSVSRPHFPVFPEFAGASYAKRYEIFITKLVRDRLYDAGCLLMSDRQGGRTGTFSEPSLELSFENFATSLKARALAEVQSL